MARYLKTGRTPEQTTAEAKKVRDTVTGIIEDIESRGETALREISEKFDKWNPPTFRLSEAEIEGCLSQLSRRNIDDIKFAQAQVHNFARAQRSSIKDVEVETLPGLTRRRGTPQQPHRSRVDDRWPGQRLPGRGRRPASPPRRYRSDRRRDRDCCHRG